MGTPIKQSEFVLGKTLPFPLIGFADVVLVTAMAAYWFDVPFRERVAPRRGDKPVPDEHAGHRSADLDHQPDTTADDDERLSLLFPRHAALRLWVPDC